MKRLASRAFWVCMILALPCLSCRLLWSASQTETGLQTLRQQWRDATWGWVAGEYIPVHSRGTVEQAAFWLPEVDRVVHLHPDKPEVAMGAAWVLDSPSTGYEFRYFRQIVTRQFGEIPELGFTGRIPTENAFESMCGPRCLELAAEATELDPSNAQWWRLRALLQWRGWMYFSDKSLRYESWTETLGQCARHDPDNALYDYVAAFFDWESSAELHWMGTKDQLVVQDAARFGRGIRHYEQGQRKPYFAVGDAGYSAVEEFLAHCVVPLSEHERIANSRAIFLRRFYLLRGLHYWQQLRADQAASAGNAKAALAMERQNLHLIDQFTSAGASTAYHNVAIAFNVASTARMTNLARQHQDLFSAEERAEIVGLYESARLDEKVVEQAGLEMTAGTTQQRAGLVLSGGLPALLRALVVRILPPLAVVLLLVGFGTIALSHRCSNADVPQLGFMEWSLAFFGACAVTVVVFGLAPTEIISREIQAWVSTLLIIMTPTGLLLWVAWRWLRGLAITFSLRAMMIFMLILCIVFAVVSVARPNVETFTRIPFDLSIPSRGWDGLDADRLQHVVLTHGRWLWAVCQWTAYHGPYLAVALWWALVAVLLGLRLWRVRGRAGDRPITFRDAAGGLFRSLGEPSLKLSAVILCVYLTLAPSVVEKVEEEFQRQMAFARRPSDHWKKVEQAVQKVRSDHQRMDQLRAAVQSEIAQARATE